MFPYVDPGVEAVKSALAQGDVLLSFMRDMQKYREPLLQAAIQFGAHYGDLRRLTRHPNLDAGARGNERR